MTYGARMAEPGEYTKRILNGRIDLSRRSGYGFIYVPKLIELLRLR